MAWAGFVEAYSPVILRTCRAVARDHDITMDAYTFVLGALQEENHRRLRAYEPDGRTRFETWLLVVTRRLTLDYIRQRYGRPRSEDEARRAEHARRRQLEDLVATEIAPDDLPSDDASPDAGIRRSQLIHALREELSRLPAHDRLLLMMRFLDERPVRDIAAALKYATVFHVYRRLSAVLATVREALQRRGVEDPTP